MSGRDCVTTSGGLSAVHLARINAAPLVDARTKSERRRKYAMGSGWSSVAALVVGPKTLVDVTRP